MTSLKFETASVSQNTLTELVGSQIWANVPTTMVRHITAVGLFGDSTTGTWWMAEDSDNETWRRRGSPSHTAFSRDYLENVDHFLAPGSKINITIWATAAAPGTYIIFIEYDDVPKEEFGL